MLLSAVSVVVIAQSSLEILEGLMNNPVLYGIVVFTALVQRVVSFWLLSKLASSYGASDFFGKCRV